MLLDIQLFAEWINAIAENNLQRAEYYYNRMLDKEKPVIDAWITTDQKNNPEARSSPFIMPEYTLKKRLESDELEAKAVTLSKQVFQANQNGDNYIMTTAISVSVLFPLASPPDSAGLKLNL